MSRSSTTFERVIPERDQIRLLFDLLGARCHPISHARMPSFLEHEAFVRGHPYRCWYLIRDGGGCTGSVYITRDNTIGIDITQGATRRLLGKTLAFVRENHAPYPGIPSIRGDEFSVNVSPGNAELIAAMKGLGLGVVQISFAIGGPGT